MKLPEHVIRRAFERYCKEGTRPYMYSLERLAGGEYVSPFTEHDWKVYSRAWLDYANARVTARAELAQVLDWPAEPLGPSPRKRKA